jgi:hypothetical protein
MSGQLSITTPVFGGDRRIQASITRPASDRQALADKLIAATTARPTAASW